MEPTPAAQPTSRKGFMQIAGAGVVASLAAFVSACAEDKQTGNQYGGAGVGTEQFGQGDAGIVAYAIFLEELESQFYRGAIASGKLSGRALELFRGFGSEEAEHLKSLQGTLRQLGGKEPEVPEFKFVFENQPGILETAAQLETVGAGAYLGQMRRIESKQVLASALSIHTVEARHAASLALLLKRPVTPDGAFANPAPSSDVQRQVQPFLSG
jgi:Ferritin-like domain